MSISMNGFNETVCTLGAVATVKKGDLVKMSANDTVDTCIAEDLICGLCVNAYNGNAGVQMTGAMTLKYSGSAPAVGFISIVADGNGGVKTSAKGRSVLCTNVNTTDSTVVVLL